MAAGSMGAFGAYKYAYSRHRDELEKMEAQMEKEQVEGRPERGQTVWVIKRYIPTDLRSTAPVPRHKPLAPSAKLLPTPDDHWIPPGDINPRYYSRDHEEPEIYASAPSTRCEEWSTLRQILPSYGRPRSVMPPNWGTGFSKPPQMIGLNQRKFPHFNSPMTR